MQTGFIDGEAHPKWMHTYIALLLWLRVSLPAFVG